MPQRAQSRCEAQQVRFDNDTLTAIAIVLALLLIGRWLVADQPGQWIPRIHKGGKR